MVGIIYEARPNVTADAFGLCFKSGNAVILKGGKDALRSNEAIVSCLRKGLSDAGLLEDAVCLITDTDRETTRQFMRLNEYVDVLIPRGGAGLIRTVVENSTIPVIENNQKNPIRCLFDADEMRVSTVSGLGRVVNYTHANVSGDRVEIGFNSKYVLDALNAADTDQVRIELSGPVSPVKVLPMTDDSFLFLVLPMRLKNEA